jgi:hypothetical protein
MFKITDNPTFWWPIKARLPSASKVGELDDMTFALRFRLRGMDHLDAAQARIRALPETERLAAQIEDTLDTVLDWRDVVDTDGRPVDYDAGVLRRLLGIGAVMRAVSEAYGEAIAGGAQRKN